jgi:retron-type reverse transcriptase
MMQPGMPGDTSRRGYSHVVDIDLEKFFDEVNHDKLTGRLAKRVKDACVLKLIRAFLEAGVMIEGRWQATEEGTPQGGPLSPVLSNILLDDLDKELGKRGHRFCRYADDQNIYVKSHRAGMRVMESICRFIENEIKLKRNIVGSTVEYAFKDNRWVDSIVRPCICERRSERTR